MKLKKEEKKKGKRKEDHEEHEYEECEVEHEDFTQDQCACKKESVKSYQFADHTPHMGGFHSNPAMMMGMGGGGYPMMY